MSLCEVARFNTRVEADLARCQLEAEGIGAVLFDADTAGFFGAAHLMAFRLMVLEEDLAAASAVLTADG